MSNAKVVHVPLETERWPIKREWVHLDDLCEGVFDCPHSTPTIKESGPYVVRSQDIRSGVFRTDEAARVSEETYTERIARAEPRYGDVLYSREGTYFGIAAEVPKATRVCLGQRMVLIRPKPDKLNSRFLRFWLNSPTLSRHINGFRDGTVAERLNMPIIRSLPVPLIDPLEQRAIVSVLGSLDDRIDVNRRMNETLETAARGIFKDWFVDFGPTRAKIGDRPPYLASKLWKLFPDRLDDEGKPSGWRSGTLRDLAQLNPEVWKAGTAPDVIEYVDLSNTKWGVIEETQTLSWVDAPSRAQRILRPGDTIVGTVRPGNGSFALVGVEGLTGSTGFAVLRPSRKEFREVVYLAATATETIERLAHLADGAAYPAVRPDVVTAQTLVVSSSECLKAFSQLTAPLLDRAQSNRTESSLLGTLRDLLLPKLMSGEIRLRDAEKLVNQVA